jgi:hypothetical protein
MKNKTNDKQATNGRNYSIEHVNRRLTKRRLVAEVDKQQADAFLACLAGREITFSHWIKAEIDKQLNT